jgi:hypothetical protein
MAPSTSIVVAADGESLTCGGFSLSETILFENLEFINDRRGVLSLPPWGTVQMSFVTPLVSL